MEQEELIEQINKELLLELPQKISHEQLQEQLARHINHLINTNFEKLVYYLYRIDVNETKMKQLLQTNHDNAGEIIAAMIIDRQLQKIKSRKQFSKRDDGIDEEDKW
jgi:N-acetylglucosamine kinase-like BadF-type ATPase